MANIYRNIGAAAKDTGGLWDQLNAHMQSAPAPESASAGMGLWDMIVAENVGGIWDEFDHETVLMRPDQMQPDRADLWREAGDETLILPKEGLLPIWDAVLLQTDAAGEMDADGTLRLLRADMENIWSQSENETLLMARPSESIFAQQIRPRDLTTYHPKRIPGYALKKLTDARGETYWILKNLRTDAYVRLTEEQVFLWEQMDGDASVQDIALAYMLEYGKLAIISLLTLLDQLQSKGFIEPLVDIYGATDQSIARKRKTALWRVALARFINTEFSLGQIDNLITRTYQRGGSLVFNPIVQWIMLAVIFAGGTAFLGLMFGLVERDVAVFAGTGAIIGVISLYVLQFITLMIHEWSHAVTTKHYGREVRRGGFLIYMGMPAAFVDTTDIWMEPRRPRIIVSWAGPHSGFFLGGLASLVIMANPGPFVTGILYQFALLTYLTSFMNMNPLLKLDGYYILMDWLEIPRLREKSLAFVGKPLRDKLRKRETWTRDEKIFAVFGVLAGVWTVVALSIAAFTLGGYVLNFAQTLPGMIIFGLLFAFWLFRWARRRVQKLQITRQQRKKATA